MASIRKIPGRKSKPWRVDIRRQGTSITQTFRTRKESSDFAAKVEADFDKWSKLLGGELRRHTLADLIDRFIKQWTGKDRSVISRAGWWYDHFGGLTLAEFNGDVVREGLARLELEPALKGGHDVKEGDKPRSSATINRYKTAISTVFKAAIDRGWYGVRENPAAGIRQRRENNNRFGKCLTDEERKTLLEACNRSSWAGLPVFVRLALATGARRGELIKLEWSDVDLQHSTVTFRDTKNADDRTVPLIRDALELLKDWRKVRRLNSTRVFPHPNGSDDPAPVDHYWRQARSRAGLDGIRLHDLRHSCGSHLAQHGASAFQIAAILGHRSGPGLTQRYVHLVGEDSRALLEQAMTGKITK